MFYKDYPTENIAIWLSHDRENNRRIHELAQNADNEEQLAAQIKHFVETNNPLQNSPNSLYQDILNNALINADYHQIAKDFLEE